MTPAEAINILTNEKKDHHSFPTDLIGQAEQLGIEALERLERGRKHGAVGVAILLPGETID